MHVITGGTYNGVDYSCMYDANNIVADEKKRENNIDLFGFYGIAQLQQDNVSSILWFDQDMNFVKGEILECCANCKYCGRSGGGFFAECLYRGFQVNNATEECCENFVYEILDER